MFKPTSGMPSDRSLDDHTKMLVYLILNQKKDLECDFLECHFESKIFSQHVFRPCLLYHTESCCEVCVLPLDLPCGAFVIM